MTTVAYVYPIQFEWGLYVPLSAGALMVCSGVWQVCIKMDFKTYFTVHCTQ